MATQRLAPLILSDDERAELQSLTMRRKTAQALALRARIVLACAEGGQNKEVAAKLGLERGTVGKWGRRFVEQRVAGLHDEPRSGAPLTIDDARIEAVIVRTLESCPENATHWSSRGMAKASGLSVSTVQRIWRAFGLQPRRLETFKLSTDPNFVAKVRDSSAFTSRRRHTSSFCVWKSLKSRRWTAVSRCCRCVPVSRLEGAMTTKGTASHRCSPPSTLRQDGSSANATDATKPPSSASSSTRSRPPYRANSTSISSWICVDAPVGARRIFRRARSVVGC